MMDRRKAERLISDYALTKTLFKRSGNSSEMSDEVAEAKEFVGEEAFIKIFNETALLVSTQKEIVNGR